MVCVVLSDSFRCASCSDDHWAAIELDVSNPCGEVGSPGPSVDRQADFYVELHISAAAIKAADAS
jgi:hypothetical protein